MVACAGLSTALLQLDTLKGMGAIDSLENFLRDYSIRLPQAYKRLVVDGVAATALHKSADSRAENVAIAETVSCMITALDALRLGHMAVDEISPLISAVCESLSKAPMIKGDHPLKVKLEGWCVGRDHGQGCSSVCAAPYLVLVLEPLCPPAASPSPIAPRRRHPLSPPSAHSPSCCRLRTLQSRPASHEISPEESRQLQFDMDSMYAAFNGTLKQAR